MDDCPLSIALPIFERAKWQLFGQVGLAMYCNDRTTMTRRWISQALQREIRTGLMGLNEPLTKALGPYSSRWTRLFQPHRAQVAMLKKRDELMHDRSRVICRPPVMIMRGGSRSPVGFFRFRFSSVVTSSATKNPLGEILTLRVCSDSAARDSDPERSRFNSSDVGTYCGGSGGRCSRMGIPGIEAPTSKDMWLEKWEIGTPKEEAKYKVIVIHGFDSSKDLNLPIPQELIEELKIYFLLYDRAGYGDSDPNPSRSVKNEASDIQELADQLQIGSRFYVIGISMGAYPAWGCLRYIPHRLSGASLVVPFVHYWWHSFPSGLLREAFRKLLVPDQWTFRVAHHAPWLLYWWMTQKWFTSLSIMAGNMRIFSPGDLETIKSCGDKINLCQEKIRQQGVHESLHRDLIAGYASWEFDPLGTGKPFSQQSGLGSHLARVGRPHNSL
ncbi:hypothetical protein NL676_031221 [Syzygium grande]|nr:hypothetical protein NL676_031221 [Syzygium grande]